LRQPFERNALHSSDASIIDKGGRDHTDVAFDEGTHEFLRLGSAGFPLRDVHGTTE
jgi:hypothetical protein